MINLREAVLDSLIDDIESIVQISEYLKFLNLKSSEAEIIEILNALLVDKKIKVVYPKEFDEKVLKNNQDELHEFWFELTEEGKEEWDKID